jgi:predicted transcriptional regulator YdeE
MIKHKKGGSTMKPKIISKDALLIAGVTGSGDETSKAWEAFTKLDKINALKNKVGEVGYEIRMYPGEGPGEVHVGVQVKDARVPAEYKVVSLPASLYAEFEIYPSKGYESSNTEMSNWISENARVYREGRLDDKTYSIEVYDKRYKGDKDPGSVVGILVPITPVN